MGWLERITDRRTQNIFVFFTILFSAHLGLRFGGWQVSSSIWPSSGLAIALMLLWGPQIWPGIFCGYFIALLGGNFGVTLSVVGALVATLEPLGSRAVLFGLRGFNPKLKRLSDIVTFILVSAIFSPFLPAILGVSADFIAGLLPLQQLPRAIGVWWLGDMLGVTLVGPLLLFAIWGENESLVGLRKFEFVLFILSALAVSLAVFFPWLLPAGNFFPHPYFAYPIVMWAATRFGQKTTALTTLCIGILGISGLVIGSHTHALPGSYAENLLALQVFMFALSLTGLIFAATQSERRQAQKRLEFRSQIDRTLLECSSLLFQTAAPQIENALVASLELLGRLTSMNRASLIIFPNKRFNQRKSYDWKTFKNEEFSFLENYSPICCPWLFHEMYQSKVIFIEQLERIPLHASLDREHFHRSRTKSLVIVPLLKNRHIEGVLGFESSERNIVWNDELSQSLQIAAELFLNALQRSLVEMALIEQSEDLKQSNADLEQFAYISSHDLKEPVRTLGLYAELLQRRCKESLDLEGKAYVDFIMTAARRMNSLISDILGYAKSGKENLSLEEVDCNEVVQISLANLESAIRETNTKIHLERLPTIYGDRLQLMQVMQNLIGNAIKYRGNKPPLISIQAFQKENVWIFSVKDNGIGIEPQFYQKIFKIFQRLHGQQSGEGTGIGLAVVRKIVEQHRGKVWVESTPGEGSTFYFSIPIRQTKALVPLPMQASN